MLLTGPELTARRARLAGVAGIDVDHLDAYGFGLVFDKALQFAPGPTVRAGADPLAGLDALADVGQVFHGDGRASRLDGFRDHHLADFGVDVGDVADFAAGALAEPLPCARAAVALKPAPKRKEVVASVPEFAAAEHLPGARGREIVFAHGDVQDAARFDGRGLGKIEDEIEMERLALADQLRFLRLPSGKEVPLEISKLHRYHGAALEGEQRQGLALEGVSALVEVHRTRGLERDRRPVAFPPGGVIRRPGFVSFGHGGHGVARPLRAQGWRSFPKRVIGQVVQRHSVGAFGRRRHGYRQIASLGKRCA